MGITQRITVPLAVLLFALVACKDTIAHAQQPLAPEAPFVTAGTEQPVPPSADPDYRGGLNIAAAALGGRIEWATDAADDTPASRLINGAITDRGWVSGEFSESGNAHPKEIVFSFANGQEARIGGFAIDTRGFTDTDDGLRNARQSDRIPGQVELLVSSKDATSGFRSVGEFSVDTLPRTQIFAIDPVDARFVMLRMLNDRGGDRVALGEVEILEAAAPGYRSILTGDGINLLAREMGGHIVIGYGSGRSQLVDGSIETDGWSAESDASPPVDLILGFRENREAVIDRIVVDPRAYGVLGDRVSKVKAYATTSRSPFDGKWQLLGEISLATPERPGVLTIPPTPVRYLRFRILDNFGGSSYQLGEIQAFEPLSPGYLSAAATRPDRNVMDAVDHPTPADSPSDAIVPVELGRTLTGVVEKPGMADRYYVDTRSSPHPGLNVVIEESPALRVGLDLLDSQAAPLDSRPLYRQASGKAEITWHMPPGEYALRVWRPLTSIVVLSDLSPSTDEVRADINRALETFVRAVSPHERVSVMGFCGYLKQTATFSQNISELEEAVRAIANGCGGTALYEAVATASEALADQEGFGAILLITDGDDTADDEDGLRKAWAALQASGARLYSIGYGAAINKDLEGATGGQLLRSWSDASGGQYYDAPFGDAIGAVIAQISRDLHEPSRYRLAVSTPSGEGLLRLVETGESLGGFATPARLGIIFDASGSMRGRLPDGGTKMVIARQVMHTLVERLPDGIQVGLRVYGHRLPREPKLLSCDDSELLVPFGPLDRTQMLRAVDDLVPKGQTPIGLSLREMEEDLAGVEGHKVIVVITDGIETCAPDPSDAYFPPMVVQTMIAHGMDVRVNVVGFDIADTQTRDLLTAIAVIGGGQYFEADDASELTDALEQAVAAPFTVYDSRNEAIASGRVGDAPVNLPVGGYRVVIDAIEPLSIDRVAIEAERETALILEKEGDRVGHQIRVGAIQPSLPPELPPTDTIEPDAATDPAFDQQPMPVLGDPTLAVSTADILFIQKALAELGYDPGPADGVPGPRTRSAIAKFQRAVGFKPDGEPTPNLVRLLEPLR